MIRIKKYPLLQSKFSVCAAAVSLLFIASACAGTPTLSQVDKYVVEACDISWGTEGNAKGQWQAPSMEDAEDVEPWSAWKSPISKLTEIRDGWQRRIIPGTAAAQIDGTFRPLADAIKGMLDTTALIVELRESQTAFYNFDGLIAYNSQLSTWRTECNATANRLPK